MHQKISRFVGLLIVFLLNSNARKFAELEEILKAEDQRARKGSTSVKREEPD